MKKLLTLAASIALMTAASAKVVAYSDVIEGGRLKLSDDACEMFTGADGKAAFVVAGGEAMDGCWKYDKENNVIHIIINGIALSLPANVFTST